MGACSTKPKHSELEGHVDHFLDDKPINDALHSKKSLSGLHGDDGKSSSFQAPLVEYGNCDPPHAPSQNVKLPVSEPRCEEPNLNCENLECSETYCEQVAKKEAVYVEKIEEKIKKETEEVLKERIIVMSQTIKQEAATSPQRKKETRVVEKEVSMESLGAGEGTINRKTHIMVAEECLEAQTFRCESRQGGGCVGELNKVFGSSRSEFRKNSYRHYHVNKDDIGLCESFGAHEDSTDSCLNQGNGSKGDKFVGSAEAQQDADANQPTLKEDHDRASLSVLNARSTELISNDSLVSEIDAVLEKLASEFERQESLSSFRSFRSQ